MASICGERGKRRVGVVVNRCIPPSVFPCVFIYLSTGSFLCSFYIDTLAEWSKAVDSSSPIFGCVGSNPTGVMPTCNDT